KDRFPLASLPFWVDTLFFLFSLILSSSPLAQTFSTIGSQSLPGHALARQLAQHCRHHLHKQLYNPIVPAVIASRSTLLPATGRATAGGRES
ncbi:MAG TPA: hypothetical protein VNG51_10490, partial [Ktedonobacteraceae bacterium]|nr:hypothetical protein [Ktedonobacteraceae bacterium]